MTCFDSVLIALLSPESHFIEIALIDLSVKLTVRGARPARGVAVKIAFGELLLGFSVTVIILLTLSVPFELLTLRLAVNLPAVA